MSRCSLLLVLFLIGATPSVTTFGSSAATTGGITSITLGATPTTGQEFVAAIYINAATAPSMSGTWTQVCADANNKEYIEVRAVTSADTSATVPVLSSASTNSTAALYEINGYAGIDLCSFSHLTQTSPYGTLTPSFVTTENADTVLSVASIYNTFSSGGTAPTFTQCSGYSTDTTANAGASSARAEINAGNKTGAAGLSNCGMQYANAGGTSTGGTFEAIAIGLLGGFPWCLGKEQTFHVGC